MLTVCICFAVTPGIAASASIIQSPCDADYHGDHCYVQRTAGDVGGVVGSLTGVTEVGGWIRSSCQYPIDYTHHLVTSEIWLVTPQHTNASFAEPEWVETGITTGVFTLSDGTTTSAANNFFWARNYWSDSLQTYPYQEYFLPSVATSGTNYIMSIRWVTGSGWRIFQGNNQVGGGSANIGPGSGMFIQAGGESSTYDEGNAGATTHLYYKKSATTISGLSGDLFVSGTAFSYTTSGIDNITWVSPYHAICN
jgi:hypothetical protein